MSFVCDSGKTVSPFLSKGQGREGERERTTWVEDYERERTTWVEDYEREIILILCSANNFAFCGSR